jgi:toxin FitB
MILLDTNVISELMRPRPEASVLSWFDSVEGQALFTSAIAEAELWAGIELLPAGQRREAWQVAVADMLAEDFADRILAFDSVAARAFGIINGTRAGLGRPISTADCQIAAIARVHGFRLATRNVRDFEHCGIDIVNPWQ